jgi:glutamate---cysteine ligase / carboxylate-amine ligase
VNAPTVGVEEEYQLVDPESGELRSRADAVLGIAWTDDLEGELQDTMVEVQTPPCRSMAEITEHLRRRRLTASAAAAAEDLEIAAAGVHPFSDWRAHTMASGDRPPPHPCARRWNACSTCCGPLSIASAMPGPCP